MWPLLLTALLGTASADPVRHALVVGADEGGGQLEKLQYAERDAEKMAEVLVELGSFDEELVTVLYAPSPTELREALAAHAAVAEAYDDDLFLLYYSGHADGSGLRLGDDRYYYESLKRDFRTVDSTTRVGILDACRSGTITRLKGAKVSQSLLGDDVAAEGEAWITASSADELAQESDVLRGGFFTHYLVSGMRGAADVDDGIVELSELYQYTRDRVMVSTGATAAGVQTPHLQTRLSGTGLALTDVREADALLIFPSGVEGLISILKLPDRTPLAEVVKRVDADQPIAVPGGRYLVRRRYDDRLYEVGLSVSDGARITVENWGAARMELGTARGEDEARIGELVAASEAYERKLNLGANPVVAGASSMVIPGAGQLYNGQVWKGLAYFGAVSALVGTTAFTPRDNALDGGWWPMLGVAVWGASAADASYNVHRREEKRPRLGATVGFSGGFGNLGPQYGANVDLMLREGVSLGLDRMGYTPGPDDAFDLTGGTRLMLASEGEHWRPGAFVGAGVRHGRLPDDPIVYTRTAFYAGTNLRYYVVTRYFLEGDLRYERDGLGNGITAGVGFGVHLGR